MESRKSYEGLVAGIITAVAVYAVLILSTIYHLGIRRILAVVTISIFIAVVAAALWEKLSFIG